MINKNSFFLVAFLFCSLLITSQAILVNAPQPPLYQPDSSPFAFLKRLGSHLYGLKCIKENLKQGPSLTYRLLLGCGGPLSGLLGG